MVQIDVRLSKPDCEVDVIEDFNRVLTIIDGIDERVESAEESVEALEDDTILIVGMTVPEVLADTLYFDVSGTGTEADPYLIKPKTTVKHSKTRYQIAAGAEPEADVYITIQASGIDKCQVEVTHDVAFVTNHYYVTILDIAGYARPRINLAGTILRTAWSVSSGTFFVEFDVNGTEVYYSTTTT